MAAHDMSLAMVPCTNCRHTYPDTALFCPNCGTAKVRTEADSLIGKVLGERFLVLDRIGQGTSGMIYRAEHVTLRRKVAIKILHAELARDDLAVERFRREATMVAEVDNEHIVEIHDFGRTPDGRLYLAMELLEGETLDAAIQREGKLSVERTADILIQLGEALMEAHAVGYIHRDLRPRNIYLAVRRGKANFVKLLDFGLSKLVESDSHAASTSLGMTFGDPHYMSPEQARGDRIDRRADIYQLGCIAYEMLTGAPPFTGKRVFDVLSRQVTESPAPLPSRRPGVPLWMEAAVARMLAKNPDDRFATTSRLVEALRLGTTSGEVMDVEVARQREAVPPASVSRVMEKLGVTTSGVQAAEDAAHDAALGARAGTIAAAIAPMVPVATPAAPAPSRPLASATISTSIAPPPVVTVTSSAPSSAAVARVSAPAAAAMPTGTSPELARRKTGTPRVGVPVAPVNAAIAAATAAATASKAAAQPLVPAAPILPEAPVLPKAAAEVAEAEGKGAAAAATVVAASPVASAAAVTSRLPVVESATGSGSLSASASLSGSSASRSSSDSASDSSSSSSSSSSASSVSGRAQGPDDPNVSQAWFEDDDPGVSRISNKKRPSAASSTDVFYDQRSRRKRLLTMGAIGAGALLIGGLALAFMGGNEPPPTETAESTLPPTPVLPAPLEPATAVEPAAVEPTTVGKPSSDATARPTPARPATASGRAAADRAALVTEPRATAPGEDPLLRRPGGGTAGNGAGSGSAAKPAAADRPVVEPPVSSGSGAGSGSAGVSGGDGTLDPYGSSGPAPSGPTPPAAGSGAAPAGGDSVSESAKQAEELASTGQQSMSRGDIAGAASSFKRATELDAKNLVAIAGLGEIALQQGLFGDAIAHLRKASKLAPRSARIQTLLGEALLNSGNTSGAADAFKRALQIDPDNARARDGYDEATSGNAP